MLYKKTRRTWSDMKKRCDNPKCKFYKNYGGRGIIYCKRWNIFENFLEDMDEKPEGKSLDRIDNNKGYSKKNCRWATAKEQNGNRSTGVWYEGEYAVQASMRLGNYKNLVQKRIKRGWPIKLAFTKLPQHKN